MLDEISPIVPVLIGVVIFFAVVAAFMLGAAWLFAHPAVIAVFGGLIVFLVWRGARRNRV